MIETLRRYAVPPAGQRQNPGAAHWLLQSLVIAALMAQPLFAQQDEEERITVPTPSRVLSVGQAHGLVFACLGLDGLAWFPAERPEVQALVHRPEWPTLSILELPDRRALLCGRDSRIRIIGIPDSGAPEVLYDWESEGLCNAAALRGQTLAIAGGGAGVTFWNWPDQSKSPRLVGRYPFNDYTKRVHFLRDNVLIAADNFETGLLVLDPSNPVRPRSHTVVSVRGFCDSAAAIGDVVFATDRVRGTHVLRLGENPADVEVMGSIPRRMPLDDRAIVQHLTTRGEDLLIAEGNAGLRWWRPAENDLGFEQAALFEGFANVVEAIFLAPDRIAAADFDRGVVILRFDREAYVKQ